MDVRSKHGVGGGHPFSLAMYNHDFDCMNISLFVYMFLPKATLDFKPNHKYNLAYHSLTTFVPMLCAEHSSP